jgi:hypothetical protein
MTTAARSLSGLHAVALAVLVLGLSPAARAGGFEGWAPLGEYELTALREGSAFLMTIPTRTGTVEVAFHPNTVHGASYHAEAVDGRARRGLGLPGIATYGGSVAPDSGLRDFAKLSYRPPRGSIAGLLRVAGVLYDLHAELALGEFLLRVDEITPEQLAEILSRCGLPDEAGGLLGSAAAGAGDGSEGGAPASAAAGELLEIELGTEADAPFVALSGGVVEANARILSIVNAMNGIYEADLGLTNRVVVQRGWSASDPYTSSDSGTLLNEFRDEFSRDIATPYDDAQLFSGRDFESNVIGRAWVSSACTGYRYGVNQGLGLSDSTIRLLVSHEEGHNLGAGHTDSGIMSPSLGSADWFNDVSQAEIASYVASVSCLESIATGQPPVLDPIGPQTVAEGALLDLQLTASDPDGDDLSFGATPLPEGASIGSDGRFLYQPPFDTAGCGGTTELQIEFFVTDTGGNRASEFVPVTVLDQPTGAAPVLDDPADRSVKADQTVWIQLAASDADGDTVSFAAPALPAGAALTDSGLFSWTPGNDDAGLHTITFVATDCTGLQTSQDVAIEVIPVFAPHLDSLTPDSGPAHGEVQIGGSDLAGGVVEVHFGTKVAQVLSASDSLLVVKAPKQKKGVTVVDVAVTRDGVASDNALPFTYSGGSSGGGGGKGNGGGRGGPRR